MDVEKEEEFVVCDNCGKQVRASSALPHSTHCFRTYTRCKTCGEAIKKADVQSHNEAFHSPKACPKCGCECENSAALESHVCPEELVMCRFCETLQRRGQLEGHNEHEAYCGSRTRPCPICQIPIPLKDMDSHRETHNFDPIPAVPPQEKPACLETPCPRCTVLNPIQSDTCSVCAFVLKTTPAVARRRPAKPVMQDATIWICPGCTLRNPLQNRRCEACNKPNPSPVAPVALLERCRNAPCANNVSTGEDARAMQLCSDCFRRLVLPFSSPEDRLEWLTTQYAQQFFRGCGKGTCHNRRACRTACKGRPITKSHATTQAREIAEASLQDPPSFFLCMEDGWEGKADRVASTTLQDLTRAPPRASPGTRRKKIRDRRDRLATSQFG